MKTRVDTLHLGHPGDAVALAGRAGETSYAALEALVASAAAHFIGMGVAAGDRVAVWLGKTPECIAALLGAMRAGAIAIPVNPVLKAAQVGHIVSDSGARVLLTNRARADGLTRDGVDTGDTTLLTVERDWAAIAAASGGAFRERGPDDLAAILYTSGSTGRPKGVMLSHRNMVLAAESVAEYLEVGPSDRTLCVLPLSFDYGLNQVLTALHVGARAVLLDYLLPRDVVKAAAQHRATGLAGVPPLWIQLSEAEWPEEAKASLRYITNSGGRMPVALTRRLRTLLPKTKIYLMYGLTEAFRSTYLDPALVDEKPESVGAAIPHAEVHVLRPDGSECDVDEPGELVHSGPLVAQGYWQDPERTAHRYRPAPAVSKAKGMAVWSGDTLVRKADGLLYFVGRDDEMIKTSGNRVSPTEIEEAAFATGLVAEVAAFGVADDRLGQAILLVARPAEGLTSIAAEAELKLELAKALPAFMQPRDYRWTDEMPRNPNGKLDRTALRETYAR